MNSTNYPTPYITLNLNKLKLRYEEFLAAFNGYKIYYAVKANPHKEVLKLLAACGSYFDTASVGEIVDVLACGVEPYRVSYGNTIKKEADIAKAFALGVGLFAIDSMAELEKIARAAPQSDIFCRLLVDCDGAQWPLTRKFGCSLEKAEILLLHAKKLGLNPRGVSFHVGSQQLNLQSWQIVIKMASEVFHSVQKHGIELNLLNLGGGFPIAYLDAIPSPDDISVVIERAIQQYFGNKKLELIIEPGRGMVGDCGVMCCEIVLISNKTKDDKCRWLYLDAGKFNGLIETLEESIRYKIVVPNRTGKLDNFIIAGPTCDSADVLYEKNPYPLPCDIQIGDKMYIYGTGAYSSSYASVSFNGFEPIKTYIE